MGDTETLAWKHSLTTHGDGHGNTTVETLTHTHMGDMETRGDTATHCTDTWHGDM